MNPSLVWFLLLQHMLKNYSYGKQLPMPYWLILEPEPEPHGIHDNQKQHSLYLLFVLWSQKHYEGCIGQKKSTRFWLNMLHNIQMGRDMRKLETCQLVLVFDTCLDNSWKGRRSGRPRRNVWPGRLRGWELRLEHVGHGTFTSIRWNMLCPRVTLWPLTKFHCLENIIIIM